ncbi:unnamed protein product, partial [Nesidiocoris tenuis]
MSSTDVGSTAWASLTFSIFRSEQLIFEVINDMEALMFFSNLRSDGSGLPTGCNNKASADA